MTQLSHHSNSDWSMGAITAYPATFSCNNVDVNITYYVGVFGIGDSDQFTIAATLRPAVRCL